MGVIADWRARQADLAIDLRRAFVAFKRNDHDDPLQKLAHASTLTLHPVFHGGRAAGVDPARRR
jgi:hypothetical protein